MKRSRYLWLAVAVTLVAGGAVTLANAGKAKEVTVIGTLIDTKCYGMNHDNAVADHMTPKGKMPKCAQACANMGIPVGVLTSGKKGGDVYILITPAASLADHMAKTVKVTGMATFQGAVTPSKVWVKNDKGAWDEVKIATMM
ncbi:MAG: hypothetical protein ACE5EO_03740 [Candidatus Krumholzibacteriia bacterium]